jgi:Fur family peroxide stress response transcriptional regulator
MDKAHHHDRDVVAKRLKDAGLKFTHQRLAIYEMLAATVTHPTAEEIYGRVKEAYPMLSLNTVYMTLDTLKTLGLIQEMRFLDNTARYDANVDAHHHVICLGCRKIEDFGDTTLDRVQPPASIRRSYRLIKHSVEFYGYCGACQKREE